MRAPRSSSRQRGFTLAEVMVATAIFAIIVVAALMIYDRSNKVFKESVEAAAVQQETRVAFDKLVRDVRMAGFDFDRDGVPMIATPTVWAANTTYGTGRVVVPTTTNGYMYIAVTGGQSHATTQPTWSTTIGEITTDNTVRWRTLQAVYQQPDEQVEYAGLSAVTIRGNLDYTTDASNSHGREETYEPAGGQFPIVTTGNDEIVTYALKSDAAGAPNNDEIHFFADVTVPRTAYPGTGGAVESEVTIGGVDLCDDVVSGSPQCIHPPYTLYRFTLDADGNPDSGTPVASNIRSLKFFYYRSPLGPVNDTTPADGVPDEQLTLPNGTVVTQGAIGGLGQYDPNNVGGTANFEHRTQRESISSIRVQLIGMNPVADRNYVNPTETNASFRNYRTYSLESLIVPRNAGLRGMQEPVAQTPTPPHIRNLCHGYCNATRVIWDPPASGGIRNYEVRYGLTWTTSNRMLTNLAISVPGDQLMAYVLLPAPPTGQQWYVNVRAYNEHGFTDADNFLRSYGSINLTKPNAVASLTTTDLSTNDYVPNQINLSWPRVTTDDNGNPIYRTLTCTGTGGDTDGLPIPAQERIRYRIWRSTSQTFDPTRGEGTLVLDFNSTNNPTVTGSTTTVNWTDDRNNLIGAAPANCTQYYYRIQAYDDCRLPAENYNNDPTHGVSEIFPRVNQNAIPGYAGYPALATPAVPAAPASLTIDAVNSTCRVGPNTCQVVLTWPRVTTDTVTPTANPLTIDTYYIERERKTGTGGTWESAGTAVLSDPNFEGNSLSASPTVTYTDTTAQHHDPSPPRERYYYRYRVRATNCSANGGFSAWEDFPDLCVSGSNVRATAATGTGGPGSAAWDMTSADYVFVNAASGVTISSVYYQLIDPGTGNAIATSTTTTAPFPFTWISGADPTTVYPLIVTVAQSTGCIEEFTVYLQDQPSLCAPTRRLVTGSSAGTGVVADPYVMNPGDTIEILEADTDLATVLGRVEFQLFDSGGAAVGSLVNDTITPFQYTWSARTPGQTYKLRPHVFYTLPAPGCDEFLPDIVIKDEICSGATTTPSGQLSGSGTSGDPWVMAAGARITVNTPSGSTPQRVNYVVQAVTPAGSAEPAVTQASAPFVFAWTNRTDDTVYRVDITVDYSTGCTETISRYVKDDPASCKLALDDPDGTIVRVVNAGDPPQAEIDIRNTGTSTFTITNIDITWNRWDGGITWSNVTFPTSDVYTVNNSTAGVSTVSIDLDPRPTGFSATDVAINAGATMTLQLNFSMAGNRDPMERSDIRKVCVTYTRADTGTRSYVCRILNATAPDASPNNPTTCD